jgi:hypothetical protein
MSLCAVCRREGRWQQHHPTGKDHEGNHLDPAFAIPMCADHHGLVGLDAKTLEVENIDEPLDRWGWLRVRLLRLAATLARIGDGDDLYSMLAGVLAGWASEM